MSKKLKMEKNKVKCEKCGLEWTPKVKKPRACPKCKSYDWEIPKKREQPSFYTQVSSHT